MIRTLPKAKSLVLASERAAEASRVARAIDGESPGLGLDSSSRARTLSA